MIVEIEPSCFVDAVCISIASLLLGHNLWLVSRKTNSRLRIEANTSDQFPESDSAVQPERVADFRLVSLTTSEPLGDYGIEGDSLVATFDATDQSYYAALELHPHPITLEAAKFADYIKDENTFDAVAPDFIVGQTIAPQRESYTKFGKALYELNSQQPDETYSLMIGHRLEIVPQASPAYLSAKQLTFQVRFDGKPQSGLRLSSGCEGVEGGKYLSHTRTDEKGLATIEIPQKGHCFVRTHLIHPHPQPENFEWESFSASLSFFIF